jgi:hypothetical protein
MRFIPGKATEALAANNAMKTLTEFPVFNLKNAVKVKQELLAGGKTAEELPQALGEALKLEGDRLNLILNAIELAEKDLEDLKRVVVYSLAEGEKAPPRSVQKGDHCFLVEYYAPLVKNEPRDKKDHGPGKPRGKRKGRGGRRGEPGKEFQKSEGAEGTEKAAGEDNSRRRRPRFPRRAPQPVNAEGAIKSTPGVITPKAKPAPEKTNS